MYVKCLLDKEQTFKLTGREVEGTKEMVSITYENLCKDVKVGNHISIDDGLVDMMVQRIGEKDINYCKDSGVPIGVSGTTNLMKVHIVGE